MKNTNKKSSKLFFAVVSTLLLAIGASKFAGQFDNLTPLDQQNKSQDIRSIAGCTAPCN